MTDIIFFLLLGLGLGSLYALLGAGLVVVYKGSGVINFAHGAFAMWGMFTFDTAWNRGEFFFPWVDILPSHSVNLPVRITLDSDGSWPMFPSLVVALVTAAFIGLAAHFLVFRPLKDAAPLGKVVASLGIALYLQGVALVNFGNSFPIPRDIFPREPIENFLGLGKAFPRNTLYALGFALLLGAILSLVYRYTRFGLATRAAASNEKGAILLGYSPQTLAAINWVTASVIATMAAIAVGSLQGAITPIGLTALIVPALAAALIGSLTSIPLAVAGGLGLGAVQTLLQSNLDWFPLVMRNGVRDAVPLLVIVLVLFLRGRSLPSRGTVEEKRLPLSPQPVRMFEHALAWIAVVTFFAFLFENSGPLTIFSNALQTSLVFMIIMLSLVVLTGYVGQISLAQMSLSGVAAFVMARMMADGVGRGSNLVEVGGPGLPWPLAAAIGIIAAIIVGLLLGLPALRIRGVQLAVVTIAAAIAIQTMFLENEELTELRAGVPAFVKTPTFFGLDIGARSARQQNENPSFAIFAVIVLCLCAYTVANIRRTGTGRRFLAVRANEGAAAAAGINVARTKLLAFGISAGIAGIGGVMLGFKQVEVSSANFPYLASLVVLAFAYLGGVTSINGGIVAGAIAVGSAIVPTVSNYYFHDTNIAQYIGALGGLGLVVTAIIHPEGIAPFFQGIMRMLGNWVSRIIPGLQTIKDAYRSGRAVPAGLGVAAIVVGYQLAVFHIPIVDGVIARMAIFAVAAVVAIALLALALGGLRPSLADVGGEYVLWARRYGPVALLGYVLGWLVWPLRVDSYSMLWMPLLGAGLALFVRSLVLRIRGGGHDAHGHGPPPAAPPPKERVVDVSEPAMETAS